MYPCSFLFMWIKLSFTTVFFPVIIKKIETSISIMQKLHSGKKFSLESQLISNVKLAPYSWNLPIVVKVATKGRIIWVIA
ncbi:hypothetical protein AOQ84DRAFT_184188 [Glonium stellatum]|uniref:Uncharacterized protein n=1 Tax=Glonium stellatum TaxID=574774 RepID=A0A8E2JWD1_9PEZI|nr:hypothetical protein AOQ84DRAFT_184188 [Glonium stellatum]